MMTASKLVTASKLALVAASTTTNVAWLPTTPDGIESQGALGLPVDESVGKRACVSCVGGHCRHAFGLSTRRRSAGF